jgi:hypothetical protein
MEIVGLLGWWYTAGWKRMVMRRVDKLAATADYFSIGLLASTLFAPFRQISAASVRGPIAIRLRALIDRLISRIIGAFARLILIVIGTVAMLIQAVYSIISIVIWAIIPLLPFIGAIVAYAGWVPRWT